jgi:hypothetical protein
MRDPVIIVHRSVEGVDDPLVLGGLVTNDSLFAIERVLREFAQEQIRDELLRAHIDLELNVVRGDLIHAQGLVKILAQQFTRSLCGADGDTEKVLHVESRTSLGANSRADCMLRLMIVFAIEPASTEQEHEDKKKTGRRTASPPGLSFGFSRRHEVRPLWHGG